MWQVVQGNNLDVLRTYPDNHFDSIVTDPPYGIDFLGKDWDATVGSLDTYKECLRVLKPGGHILAFSAARTYHHLAVTIEQAGFEIRDQLMWIYSSGFPKSQDIGRSIERSLNKALGKPNKVKKKLDLSVDSNRTMGFSSAGKNGQLDAGLSGEIIEVTHPKAKAWEGWGTNLKPAHEPIVMARKPLGKDLSIARNCQTWGVGALNIDATRVPRSDLERDQVREINRKGGIKIGDGIEKYGTIGEDGASAAGSVLLNEDRFPSNVLGDIPDYQKYFYCPKVSRRERHVGFDAKDLPPGDGTNMYSKSPDGTQPVTQANKLQSAANKGNNHPTVKPIALMRYLITLVTPPGGHVLDPFNGSGSTGCAAVELGMSYTGLELDAGYCDIARRRITAWHERVNNKPGGPTTFEALFE